ncbi:phosphoribosylanthranilate isomerase [Flavobacteriaceae bacterium 14752]|uniref:phosphoribosylanthranilate isomerase n=1 Tax=Mesohalobacter salilacus TaxID=2491711 RepID=UPI000F63DDE4|nr:phosphoribosylanthranilate isomerase [Flavobacteriaceae bacterium 14752]
MIVKVCGMTNVDNLKAIAAAMPDYFGFIFYEKSPRAIKIKTLPKFKNIQKVGVFVNATHDYILKNQQQYKLNGVQLHGEEDISYVKALKEKLPNDIKIFKAISVENASDFKAISSYENYVDMIVLDTKTKLKGGSGKQFDWNLLNYYDAEIPFLLSGGISKNDANKVLELQKTHPKMIGVDINSKFEIKPGLKDVNKVNTFIKNIKI